MKRHTARFFALAWVSLMPIAMSAQKILGDKNFILENDRIEDVIDSDKPEITPPPAESIPLNTPDDSVRISPKEVAVATDFTPSEPTFRNYELPEKPTSYGDNFAKIGLGRYLTPMAQLYIARSKGANRYGFWGSHLSAHADSLTFRNFREDFGTLWFERSLKNRSTLFSSFKAYNTQYFRYADTTRYASDDIRKERIVASFTRLDLNANWKSNFDASKKLAYQLGFQTTFYQDKAQNQEINLGISPSGSYAIGDKLRLCLNTGVAYIMGSIAQRDNNRFWLDVAPTMEYKHDALYIAAGLRYAYLHNGGENANYSVPVPLVDIRYALRPDGLTLFAGFTGGIQTPRLYEYRQQNRFVSDSVKLRPVLERINAFGGVRGNLGEKIDYLAKVSYRQLYNALIYTYSPQSADFSAFYDSLTKILGIHIEANYSVSSVWHAGIRADINRFQTTSAQSYFQVSPLRMDVYASYAPIKALKLRMETYFLGKTPMSVAANGSVIYRKWISGVNLSADYQFARRFSAFAMAQNLLNQRYAWWFSYQERPLDYRLGITFHF